MEKVKEKKMRETWELFWDPNPIGYINGRLEWSQEEAKPFVWLWSPKEDSQPFEQ